MKKTGHDVLITVKAVKRRCPQGYKVGDSWLIDRNQVQGRFCLTALCNVLPVLRTMRYGGTHTWDQDEDVTTVACPDVYNLVIFEVRRLPTDVAKRRKRPPRDIDVKDLGTD